MSRYWIVDPHHNGELKGSKEAIGPFRTVREAEKWLVHHHTEMFDHSDGSFIECLGEHNNWSNEVLIVQHVKTVRPVPVVSAKIILKEEKQ